MKKSRLLGAVCTCIFTLFSTSASSALVDLGTTTQDADTGLLWLDLSESINRSFNDVSTQLGIGGDFEGYRYATQDEVVTFFSNAGITGFVNGFNDFNYQPVLDLAALLGTPFSQASPNQQLHGLLDVDNTVDTRRTILLFTNHTDDTGGTGISAFLNSSADNNHGHWLVSTVPIPAAVWLFGSGLLGLVGVARRKKSA